MGHKSGTKRVAGAKGKPAPRAHHEPGTLDVVAAPEVAVDAEISRAPGGLGTSSGLADDDLAAELAVMMPPGALESDEPEEEDDPELERVKALARDHSENAVNALVDVAELEVARDVFNDKGDVIGKAVDSKIASAKVAAAKALLEWGFGRPPQRTSKTDARQAKGGGKVTVNVVQIGTGRTAREVAARLGRSKNRFLGDAGCTVLESADVLDAQVPHVPHRAPRGSGSAA